MSGKAKTNSSKGDSDKKVVVTGRTIHPEDVRTINRNIAVMQDRVATSSIFKSFFGGRVTHQRLRF